MNQVAPRCRVEYAVPRQGPKGAASSFWGLGSDWPSPSSAQLGDGVRRDGGEQAQAPAASSSSSKRPV